MDFILNLIGFAQWGQTGQMIFQIGLLVVGFIFLVNSISKLHYTTHHNVVVGGF